MLSRPRNQVDFLAGLMFTVLGAAFAILSLRYRLGTAGAMGPGYFPFVLGLLLGALGLIILASSMKPVVSEDAEMDAVKLRPLLLVTLSVGLFGILLVPLGFVASSFILVFLSALASREFHWRYAFITAVVMIVTCYVLFVYGLGLPLPIWPRFL